MAEPYNDPCTIYTQSGQGKFPRLWRYWLHKRAFPVLHWSMRAGLGPGFINELNGGAGGQEETLRWPPRLVSPSPP